MIHISDPTLKKMVTQYNEQENAESANVAGRVGNCLSRTKGLHQYIFALNMTAQCLSDQVAQRWPMLQLTKDYVEVGLSVGADL